MRQGRNPRRCFLGCCPTSFLDSTACDCRDRIPEPSGNRSAKQRTARPARHPEIPRSPRESLSCRDFRYRRRLNPRCARRILGNRRRAPAARVCSKAAGSLRGRLHPVLRTGFYSRSARFARAPAQSAPDDSSPPAKSHLSHRASCRSRAEAGSEFVEKRRCRIDRRRTLAPAHQSCRKTRCTALLVWLS